MQMDGFLMVTLRTMRLLIVAFFATLLILNRLVVNILVERSTHFDCVLFVQMHTDELTRVLAD
ncbi:hypothetical protein [Xanthomonas phage Carpasina]|uniref:Uncharacterized protein n=1 Tax=Xanthomonas phage Carpasina TaxID=2163636 RepID=A0A2S1GSY9_9CAUD|nr:hypothetical protein HOT16_gp71 [Xanthomonas phage Carpasina]AWD92466.1 hypothetical protein [Xanthomonas phage Carpasina]